MIVIYELSSSSMMRIFDILFTVTRPFRLGPHLRKKRLSMVSKYASGKILDVGCGSAEVVGYLQNEVLTSYMGIDNNKELIEKLRHRYPSLNVYLMDIDNQDLSPDVSEPKFDTVLFVTVMEHLKRPKLVLEKTSKMLNCDGKLIATVNTPAGERIYNILAIFGLTNRGAVGEHKAAARAAWSFKDLCDLVLPLGFQVEVYRKFEFGLNQIVVFRKTKARDGKV